MVRQSIAKAFLLSALTTKEKQDLAVFLCVRSCHEGKAGYSFWLQREAHKEMAVDLLNNHRNTGGGT